MRPTTFAFSIFSLTTPKPCLSALKLAGIIGPPAKPSSTTSTNRALGENIEFTKGRLTPGIKYSWSCTAFNWVKN
jgi:hypothetical protein